LHGLQVAVDLLHEYGGIDRPMSAYDFTDLRFQANLSRLGQGELKISAARKRHLHNWSNLDRDCD